VIAFCSSVLSVREGLAMAIFGAAPGSVS